MNLHMYRHTIGRIARLIIFQMLLTARIAILSWFTVVYGHPVVKSVRKPLDRQVSEALEIYNSEAEILMNSGAEWRASQVPRAAVARPRLAWNWWESLWKNQVWKNFEFYENLSTVYCSNISAWKRIIYKICCWFNSEIICSIEMFYGMNQTVTAAFAAPPPNFFVMLLRDWQLWY